MEILNNFKCVATSYVACDLSLITTSASDCRLFSDINNSQGTVPTHLGFGEVFKYHFIANSLMSLTVKQR